VATAAEDRLNTSGGAIGVGRPSGRSHLAKKKTNKNPAQFVSLEVTCMFPTPGMNTAPLLLLFATPSKSASKEIRQGANRRAADSPSKLRRSVA
jgi:hypothetical protein